MQKDNEEFLIDLKLFKNPSKTIRSNEKNISHIQRMSLPSMLLPKLPPQETYIFDHQQIHNTSQNVRELSPSYIDVIEAFSQLSLSND